MSKSRRRFTKQESTVIQRVHKQHKGDWFEIMEDAAIKQMGVQSHQIAAHISNLAKTARKKAREVRLANAPIKTEFSERTKRATDAPDYRAMDAMEGSEASIDSDDTSSGDDGSRTTSFDESDAEPQGDKRKRDDRFDRASGGKKPRQTGVGAKGLASLAVSGSPESEMLCATSVASLDVQTMDDMMRITSAARADHKQSTAKKRERKEGTPRARETSGLIDSLQHHQTVLESQGAVQSTMQLMALKMMKQLATDIEKEEDTTSILGAVNALRDDVLQLRSEIAALHTRLADAQPAPLLFETL